jgi:hypothetical protein
MKYMSSDVGSNNETAVETIKKIDWNDFNYPICLKIFHYDAEETP